MSAPPEAVAETPPLLELEASAARLRPAASEAVLARLNLFNYVDRYVAVSVAPSIKEQFSLSDFQAGAIISAFGDTAEEKAEMMLSDVLTVEASASELGSTVNAILAKRPQRATATR